MRTHIIDELRPHIPEIDPAWESETMRAILDSTPPARSTRRLVRLTLVAATVAVLAGGAVVARNALPSDEVRPAGPASQGPSTSPTTPTTTQDAPAPAQTYVPAPGDPTNHEVNVTIRDRGRSYDPDTCVATAGNSEAPDVLAFSGPDRTNENRPLKDAEFPIPDQGTKLADGTCEATMTVTVQYAPRYQAGIAQEGGGIAGPDSPSDTKITTTGDSQDVVIVNYAT